MDILSTFEFLFGVFIGGCSVHLYYYMKTDRYELMYHEALKNQMLIDLEIEEYLNQRNMKQL